MNRAKRLARLHDATTRTPGPNRATAIHDELFRQWRPDDKTPGAERRVSSLGDYLAKPDKQVTRAELWEFLCRYEAGRRQFDDQQRRYHVWYRRLWRWLSQPVLLPDSSPLPEAPCSPPSSAPSP